MSDPATVDVFNGPLAKDHPLFRAVTEAIPSVTDIANDDPYVYLLFGAEKLVTRMRMSPSWRAALLAYARGEAMPLGTYRLDPIPFDDRLSDEVES